MCTKLCTTNNKIIRYKIYNYTIRQFLPQNSTASLDLDDDNREITWGINHIWYDWVNFGSKVHQILTILINFHQWVTLRKLL
jgi:hypothetical protein